MFSPNHINCVNPELLSRIRNNKEIDKHIQLANINRNKNKNLYNNDKIFSYMCYSIVGGISLLLGLNIGYYFKNKKFEMKNLF